MNFRGCLVLAAAVTAAHLLSSSFASEAAAEPDVARIEFVVGILKISAATHTKELLLLSSPPPSSLLPLPHSPLSLSLRSPPSLHPIYPLLVHLFEL